ncbi:MAG: NAD(P)H-dependent oxidoreductase subunit E [Bacteroidota bacterium]
MLGEKIYHKLYEKQNKNVCFSDAALQKAQSIISHYPAGKQKSALLPLLHIAQEEFGGSLTVDIMDYVASILHIQPIEVYEVATFYTQFYLDTVGKYVIEVCQTSPCALCGGEDIQTYIEEKLNIKNGETTADGLFTLKTVECLGACGYAPAMQINTEFYEFVTPTKINTILKELSEIQTLEKPSDSTWVGK